MNDPSDEYKADFNDALLGLREELATHQEAIYREIESKIIDAWKEIQRIQADIIKQIADSIPGRI